MNLFIIIWFILIYSITFAKPIYCMESKNNNNKPEITTQTDSIKWTGYLSSFLSGKAEKYMEKEGITSQSQFVKRAIKFFVDTKSL